MAEAFKQGQPLNSWLLRQICCVASLGRSWSHKLAVRGWMCWKSAQRSLTACQIKKDRRGWRLSCASAGLALIKCQLRKEQPWVALDAVADPGNLGTIMRTHDAAGGEGIILLDQSTDPYDPSAVRASMGALFTSRSFVPALMSSGSGKSRSAVPWLAHLTPRRWTIMPTVTRPAGGADGQRKAGPAGSSPGVVR